jgi:hypothetical protein
MAASSLPSPVAAQEILFFPLSARVTSMGQAGAADNSTPSTIVLNPANVIGAPRLYMQGTDVKVDFLEGDLWMRRANAGTSLRAGSVMLGFDVSYARLHAKETFEFTTVPLELTEDLVGLAVGAGFVSGKNDFLLGAAVKRYSEDETSFDYFTLEKQTSSADATAFDAGFEFRNRATLQGWDVNSALAVAVLDEGSDYEARGFTQDLPRRLNGGLNVRMVSPTIGVLSARVPLIAFVASVDAMKPIDDGDWEWMAGTELAVAQIFFLRSGIHTFTGSRDPDPSDAGWGAGLGIPAGKMRVRFDYGRDNDLYFVGKKEHFELTLEWQL